MRVQTVLTTQKQDASNLSGKELPLMEEFYSVQGEGYNNGVPAYFLRLAGCDVGCKWCDVKESWEADAHPVVHVNTMTERVLQSGATNVVITGGEPTLHNLDPLTRELKRHGLSTWIETAGTNELTGFWDWVCFSPKKFKVPHESIYAKVDELKVVINHRSDFRWAEQHAARVSEECQLFLQPEWSRRDQLMPSIFDFVLTHPRWRISLQTHKYLNVR